MKITKEQLKQIIKEEIQKVLSERVDGEAECKELQNSWNDAYNEFQSAGGRKNTDALGVWSKISARLKKQAKNLVVGGRVGGCPMMTAKELEG